MRNNFFRIFAGALISLTVVSCTKVTPWLKSDSSKKGNPGDSRLKLVWLSLDGLQADALEPWVSKLKSPHPKGLSWMLKSAHGRSDFKVINPTITAPSHISTITCSGAGAHGILDNSTWTGNGTTSGFNKPYAPENWITRLRKQGLRVGSALYPSIDGTGDGRQADVGIFYDNPGSQPQILTVAKGNAVGTTVPDRTDPAVKYPIEVQVSAEGGVSAKTPWGKVERLTIAKPADVMFTIKIAGIERKAAVSFLLVSTEPTVTVEVSPIQIMPVMGSDFAAELDAKNIVFSSVRDYRIQSNAVAYLASLEHRRRFIVDSDLAMLGRGDLDAVFLYFEDLDATLHAYYKDEANEGAIVDYLNRLDQDLGRIVESVPSSADFVVVGDHGMSAIAYVLNARKILTEAIAAKGTVMASGGALYVYPPQGDIVQAPPSNMDLNAIADGLRAMDLDLTGNKIFAKVLVRGSKEAEDEGLSGNQVPWIMAFANDGIGFKNSIEDKFLLARANWAVVPENLRAKYPDPTNNGVLVTPTPAGQHGHWNDIQQMRTKLVLEGPRLSKIDPQLIEKSLQLVPVVADSLGLPRPASCEKP